MVRVLDSLVRRLVSRLLRRDVVEGIDAMSSRPHTNGASDADIWVNARGKRIGSKRSRTKRLDRLKERDMRQAQRAIKAISKTARF